MCVCVCIQSVVELSNAFAFIKPLDHSGMT